MKKATGLLVVTVTWVVGGWVAAQPAAPSESDVERAKELYAQAEEYKQQADKEAAGGNQEPARRAYGEAAQSYLAGYHLSRRPLFLYNLGSVYRLRGDKRWAVQCYRAFLATGQADAGDAKDAETFIAELEGALAAGDAAGDQEPALDPGAACPGEAVKRVEPEPVVKGEVVEGSGGVDGAGGVVGAGDEDGSGDGMGGEVFVSGKAASGRGYRAAFFGAAGVTVVSAAGAGLFMLQMMALEDDKFAKIRELQALGVVLDPADACADAAVKQQQEVVDICDQGASKATMSNVLQGVALVGAVAAGYFYYKGYVSKPGQAEAAPATAVRVVPVIGSGAVGAELAVSF